MPENRLKELRKEWGLKQAELAEKIGVDAATISRWERGEVPIPDWRKQQLAEYFVTTVPALMGWDKPDGNGNGNGEEVAA